MARAQSYDDIRPLIELCKGGKLFDVQVWIAAGRPVDPPPPPERGHRPWSPLQYAIEVGFHSLVQVLLDAGAEIEDSDRYASLDHALQVKEYDIAKLLVAHGADATAVDMGTVFHTWEPDLMEYFIERGADVETDAPLAEALCSRIRTALRIYKHYRDRFPTFPEQANIALRHHCKDGNLKWVSLMLWAGADPYAPGPDSPQQQPDSESDISAVELAALHGKLEVLALKQLRLGPTCRRADKLVYWACCSQSADLLQRLLHLEFPVNDQPNGGSSHIETVLNYMGWWSPRNRKSEDSPGARERMKMVYLLVTHGARWIPGNKSDMNRLRRCMLGLTPDYTLELVWLMAKHGACQRSVIEELLKTGTIRAHVAGHSQQIGELVKALPATLR